MATTFAFDPDTMRRNVRLRTYNNATEEQEAIATVDGELFALARDHEIGLSKVGEDIRASNGRVFSEVGDLAARVAEFERGLESGTITPTAANARQLAKLRREVEDAQGTLARSRSATERQIPKLEDPWSSWSALISRFPPLTGHLRARMVEADDLQPGPKRLPLV